jgi:hypothetical protein
MPQLRSKAFDEPAAVTRWFTLIALVIGLLIIVGSIAPWYLLSTGESSRGSFQIWDNGFSYWGVGNSIFVFAIITLGAGFWTLLRSRRAAVIVSLSFFTSVFVVMIDDILSFGNTSSGWQWDFIRTVLGWGPKLVLVASIIGAALTARWVFVGNSRQLTTNLSPIDSVGGVSPTSRSEVQTRFPIALVVLGTLIIVGSYTTWESGYRDGGTFNAVAVNGATMWAIGFVLVILTIVLILSCVWYLIRPTAISVVLVVCFATANLVVIVNFLANYLHPVQSSAPSVMHLDWGFDLTFVLSIVSCLIAVVWARVSGALKLLSGDRVQGLGSTRISNFK